MEQGASQVPRASRHQPHQYATAPKATCERNPQPHYLVRHADRANSVSLWVAGMILLQPTSKTRRKMFSKFAVVAAVRHACPLLLDSMSLTQPDFTQHSN